MNVPTPDPVDSHRLPRRRTEDLIDHLRQIADKLDQDGSSRGDLKLLTRTLQELRYAFKTFTPFRRRLKVTVFGSARTSPDAPAYRQAEAFARQIVQRDWMVVTGAASGIMEAGHVGAGREHSLGLNIMLPFEQQANAVIHGDKKLVHMKYFFTRKLMFVKESQAVVCCPGGFGTLDEMFEVLTLLQTGKCDLMPLVLLDEPGGHYWQALQSFIVEHLLAARMISEEDHALYRITDSVDEAIGELTSFYRVYHSMRYVKEMLVLRLNGCPDEETMRIVREDFRDISRDGEFTLTGPLPAEANEPELSSLRRLAFRFNRRNLGRLRQLIDLLNQRVSPP